MPYGSEGANAIAYPSHYAGDHPGYAYRLAPPEPSPTLLTLMSSTCDAAEREKEGDRQEKEKKLPTCLSLDMALKN